MAISHADILDAVANMTVMEIVDLITAMEEKFGVSAAVAVAAAAPAAAAAEEQTEFDVIMTGFGENKVAVIKVVRGITGLGLKEANKKNNMQYKKIKNNKEKKLFKDIN